VRDARGLKGQEREQGVLGRRQRAPTHPLGGLEESSKLPQRHPKQNPEKIEFRAFWDSKITQLQHIQHTRWRRLYMPSHIAFVGTLKNFYKVRIFV